ncbi:MAG: hypothetical protein HFG99_08110 [Dorea sp.]|jgi:hypothetical protein|nr:hypothetical protein [Dorea sp.]MCI9249100.1 hypothetical protein [Dorea sp.]
MKIQDFGEKIGGARKDMWKREGLGVSDLESLNEAERAMYVTKQYVWPMPSGKEQVKSGTDVFVAYWQRTIRNMSSPAPRLYQHKTKLESIETFIIQLGDLRDHVMACRTRDDVARFEEESVKDDYDIGHWSDIIRIGNLRFLKWQKGTLARKMERANFPEGKKIGQKQKKRKFMPPQLDHIERTGTDYRRGRHITPKQWQKEFGFRGVEFGNWCSQADRRVSMDMCYDALKDMAYAVRIMDSDVTFGGSLALAFGARGHSAASAHYEPLREVINLTKMNGAGCTAHEWAHALDDKLAKTFGGQVNKLASEQTDQGAFPESFVKLVNGLRKDADGNLTDYFRGSKHFDRLFSKDGHGYWASPCEMFARAFACYVKDTLGEKSDYLYAHADCYEFEFDDQSICAIPQGEEREIFDEMFDLLFHDLRRIGFFHERVEEEESVIMLSDFPETEFPFEDDGQLLLFL